jgi:hypothetical protein
MVSVSNGMDCIASDDVALINNLASRTVPQDKRLTDKQSYKANDSYSPL